MGRWRPQDTRARCCLVSSPHYPPPPLLHRKLQTNGPGLSLVCGDPLSGQEQQRPFSTRGMGFASPNRTNHRRGPAAMPTHCPSRAAREVLGRAEDMHLGLKAAPNTVLDIYPQRAQAGRREGGSSSVPTAFCSKCLTEAISQHRDLEAMPVFTSLFRLTRTE